MTRQQPPRERGGFRRVAWFGQEQSTGCTLRLSGLMAGWPGHPRGLDPAEPGEAAGCRFYVDAASCRIKTSLEWPSPIPAANV